MLYNNLIYFIVVIFIVASNSASAQPSMPFMVMAAIFLGKLLFFRFVISEIIFNRSVRSPSKYAVAERSGTILAIVFFAIDIYFLDCQFYFAKLPFAKQLPVISDILALMLFTVYLTIMWGTVAKVYTVVFGRTYLARAFIANNIRTNLPIILPWLLLSLIADLISAAPVPAVHQFLNSPWGETFSSLCFLAIMVLVLPFMLIRLWQCTPLPPGLHRALITDLCQKLQVPYNNILLWPLHEGRALTAGVIGFAKMSRYILVTRALLDELSSKELQAVIAHEIGHVKKRHLQLYLVVFLSFAFLLQFATEPLFAVLSNSDLFYTIVDLADKNPGESLLFAGTLPTLILMVVYFRYILGFFMRNFERQADLYALGVMQSASSLVQVFEKIAWLSGNIRDQPCWHHFSIGQRVDFLNYSEQHPEEIGKHDRKVLIYLVILLTAIACGAMLLWKTPHPSPVSVQGKYAESVIKKMIKEDPQNAQLYRRMGDLQYGRKKYSETIQAYEQSLAVTPDNAEVLNSLAWLLLTVDDKALLDYKRGLELAKEAFVLKPQAHILDTLALGYWLNGSPEQAVLAEKRAISLGSENMEYYKSQLQKYQNKP